MVKNVKVGNDWKLTAKKVGKYLLFTVAPALIAYFLDKNPAIAAITVGGLLTLFADWFKHRK